MGYTLEDFPPGTMVQLYYKNTPAGRLMVSDITEEGVNFILGSGSREIMDINAFLRLVNEQKVEISYQAPPEPQDEGVLDELWPDFLPWSEAEQDYYRNSSIIGLRKALNDTNWSLKQG